VLLQAIVAPDSPTPIPHMTQISLAKNCRRATSTSQTIAGG
jgi:hypothetical protein